MPNVNFGNDIEFHVPEKPFFNPNLEPNFSQEPFIEQTTVNDTPKEKTNTAIYDRNWLLQ